MISNLGEGYKATNFPDAKGWVGAGTKRGLPKAMTDFKLPINVLLNKKVKVPEEQHNIFMIVMVSYLLLLVMKINIVIEK